jgi:hypothetical protein
MMKRDSGQHRFSSSKVEKALLPLLPLFLGVIMGISSACTKKNIDTGAAKPGEKTGQEAKIDEQGKHPTAGLPTDNSTSASKNPNQSNDQGQTIGSETDSAVAMSFPRASFAEAGVDLTKLYFTLSFKDESGKAIVDVPKTKLDFTGDAAKVIVKVTAGSKGYVSMDVVDEGPSGQKFAGKSDLITVTGNTVVDLKLKKVPNDGGDTGNGNDANVDIDIDQNGDSGQTGDSDQNGDTNNEIRYLPYSETLSLETIKQWAATDRAKRGTDASFIKYTYLPNAIKDDKDKANLARVGVFKALNSTSMGNSEIVLGEDVSDGHGLLFAFDIRKFWGDKAQRNWQTVAGGRGKNVFASAPAQSLRSFPADEPVRVDRLAYNLTHGKVYNVLIDNPPYEQNLRRQQGIKSEIVAWAAQKNAIVDGPRIAWLRELPDGRKYWATGDEFYGREGKEIPYASGDPVVRLRGGARGGMLAIKGGGTVASEAWMEMKNGLISYYIWGNAAQERTRAEQSFIIDPANKRSRFVINGRSCITCHAAGSQGAPSDMATYIDNGRISSQYVTRAKEFWTTNDKLEKIYAETRVKFQEALGKIVYGISDGDKAYNEKIKLGGGEAEPLLFLINMIER